MTKEITRTELEDFARKLAPAAMARVRTALKRLEAEGFTPAQAVEKFTTDGSISLAVELACEDVLASGRKLFKAMLDGSKESDALKNALIDSIWKDCRTA